MKIRVGKKQLILLFGISAFLLNYVLRSSFIHVTGISLPGQWGALNLLAIIALLLIIVLFARGFKLNKRSIRPLYFMAIFLYTALVAYSNEKNGNEIGKWVLYGSIIPGVCMCGFKYDTVDFKDLFKKFLKITNVAFYIIFAIGIMDYFLGGIVNNFLAERLSDEGWAAMIRGENATYGFRMCTIIGAPLMNAFYALVMMGLNAVYKRTTGKSVFNLYVTYIIGMLTIFLTGSRTALLLGVVLIAFCELKGKWAMGKIFLLVMAFAVIINTQLFQETVGARMKLGFMNETDARYSLWLSFVNHKYGSLNMFSGGGYNYSRELTATVFSKTMNFEYPVLMFLFDYGIIATILYYVIFFIYPIIRLVKKEQFFMIFAYSILFAFLQTCNIAAQFYDFNLQLGFIILILTEFADQIEKKDSYIEKRSKG